MYKTCRISILTLVITILIVIGITDCCTTVYAAYLGDDHGTFDTFYQKNIGTWGWIGIGAGAVASVVIGVVITIYTMGITTPAWCAAVGSWIGGTMGLHGIAATNAGLAFLGGGSIAAGGFGMAGGVAVLTAVTTFSGELILGYGIEKAISTYSSNQFAKECRNMLHLPCPVNTKGGHAYYEAQQYIETNLDIKKLITDGNNPQVIQKAITFLEAVEPIRTENDEMDRMKNKTMLALLYWLSGKPNDAASKANSAIHIANQWNEGRWAHNFKATPTIAEFILSVCNLELGKTEKNSVYFEYAILREPSNKLIPLLFGIYLDRLMMLYHYEKAGLPDIESVVKIAKDESIVSHAPVVSTILAARILVEIKRYQQDILIITESTDDAIRKKDNIKTFLNEKLKRYNELVNIGRFEIVPLLAQYDASLPKELKNSPYRNASVSALLEQYEKDVEKLTGKIEAFN